MNSSKTSFSVEMRLNKIEWEETIFTVHEWEWTIFRVSHRKQMVFTVHKWEWSILGYALFDNSARNDRENSWY